MRVVRGLSNGGFSWIDDALSLFAVGPTSANDACNVRCRARIRSQLFSLGSWRWIRFL